MKKLFLMLLLALLLLSAGSLATPLEETDIELSAKDDAYSTWISLFRGQEPTFHWMTNNGFTTGENHAFFNEINAESAIGGIQHQVMELDDFAEANPYIVKDIDATWATTPGLFVTKVDGKYEMAYDRRWEMMADRGFNYLTYAIFFGMYSTVKSAVTKFPEWLLYTISGSTVFHVAAIAGYEDIMEFLLGAIPEEYKFITQVNDDKDRTPLTFLFMFDHVHLFKLFYDHGIIEFNEVTMSKTTIILHMAAHYKAFHILDFIHTKWNNFGLLNCRGDTFAHHLMDLSIHNLGRDADFDLSKYAPMVQKMANSKIVLHQKNFLNESPMDYYKGTYKDIKFQDIKKRATFKSGFAIDGEIVNTIDFPLEYSKKHEIKLSFEHENRENGVVFRDIVVTISMERLVLTLNLEDDLSKLLVSFKQFQIPILYLFILLQKFKLYKSIIDLKPELLHFACEYGNIFHVAAKNEDSLTFSLLLKTYGFKHSYLWKNGIDKHNFTPIAAAVATDHVPIVKMVFETGLVSLDERDVRGETLLAMAVRRKAYKVLDYFLSLPDQMLKASQLIYLSGLSIIDIAIFERLEEIYIYKLASFSLDSVILSNLFHGLLDKSEKGKPATFELNLLIVLANTPGFLDRLDYFFNTHDHIRVFKLASFKNDIENIYLRYIGDTTVKRNFIETFLSSPLATEEYFRFIKRRFFGHIGSLESIKKEFKSFVKAVRRRKRKKLIREIQEQIKLDETEQVDVEIIDSEDERNDREEEEIKENEEKQRKENEEKQRKENEEKQRKENEEKQRKDKEQKEEKERLDREEKERKVQEEKERKEKERKEEKERIDREEKDRKVRKLKEEKERIRKEQEEKKRQEKEEKERIQKEQEEKERIEQEEKERIQKELELKQKIKKEKEKIRKEGKKKRKKEREENIRLQQKQEEEERMKENERADKEQYTEDEEIITMEPEESDIVEQEEKESTIELEAQDKDDAKSAIELAQENIEDTFEDQEIVPEEEVSSPDVLAITFHQLKQKISGADEDESNLNSEYASRKNLLPLTISKSLMDRTRHKGTLALPEDLGPLSKYYHMEAYTDCDKKHLPLIKDIFGSIFDEDGNEEQIYRRRNARINSFDTDSSETTQRSFTEDIESQNAYSKANEQPNSFQDRSIPNSFSSGTTVVNPKENVFLINQETQMTFEATKEAVNWQKQGKLKRIGAPVQECKQWQAPKFTDVPKLDNAQFEQQKRQLNSLIQSINDHQNYNVHEIVQQISNLFVSHYQHVQGFNVKVYGYFVWLAIRKVLSPRYTAGFVKVWLNDEIFKGLRWEFKDYFTKMKMFYLCKGNKIEEDMYAEIERSL